jgi:carnitine-CoA ligase
VRRTIPELFRRTVERIPDTVWLVAGDDRFTYAEALDLVERQAGALRAAGAGRDDRVLVTARNRPDYLLNWLALMEIGAVQVPLNPASSAGELAGFARQADPALVVTDADLGPEVHRALVDAGSTASVLDVEALADGTPDGGGPAPRDPTDVAVMIPTSGTTGRSKLVMQTHVAYVMAGEGFPYWMQLTAEDRLMTSLPLFHVNAPAYSTLGSVAAGAGLVLLPSFSASTFLDSARRHGATEFNSIGAMLEILMRQPERTDDADTPLRRCYTGPSPERERHLEIERRFGIEIVCGYGLSESTYGLIWPHGKRPYGTLGSARQHPELGRVNEARVIHEGREVGQGEVGELELRNPAIMRGYYEMPEETAEVLVDGWLRTGDLVRVDADDTYTFVSRKKDVIRRRGENLSPAEVEAVLDRHPDVAEAAVIGVPAELSDEDVKAFVTAAPGRTVDPYALADHAAAHLARFKVPRWVEVVAELPHTATGRLAKHRLPTARTPAEIDLEATRPGSEEP